MEHYDKDFSFYMSIILLIISAVCLLSVPGVAIKGHYYSAEVLTIAGSLFFFAGIFFFLSMVCDIIKEEYTKNCKVNRKNIISDEVLLYGIRIKIGGKNL